MSNQDETADNVDCADLYSVDFTYSFLRNIDPARPPAAVVIPEKCLRIMGNMERQYWEIKSQIYNVVLFFKKGKFYELYDYDAVIAHREFGLKMVMDTSNRGKMRLAGVPEQSYNEWARLFVFRGYKVGRVEQMQDASSGGTTITASMSLDDVSNRANSISNTVMCKNVSSFDTASKSKIMPRVLVEVLTPGTLKEASMLAGHSEVFLLALVPMYVGGESGNDVSVGAIKPGDSTPYEGQAPQLIIDAVAVDLSRQVALWCPCGHVNSVERMTKIFGCEKSRSDDVHGSGGPKDNHHYEEDENTSHNMSNNNDNNECVRNGNKMRANWCSVLTGATKQKGMMAESSVMSTSSHAFNALSALLQHICPREIIIPQLTGLAMPSDAQSGDVALLSALRRWVEAEGFAVDAVTIPAELARAPLDYTSARCSDHTVTNKHTMHHGAHQTSATPVSPAHLLVSHYFHHLRLGHEVPLLAQSHLFSSHLFSTVPLSRQLSQPIPRSNTSTQPLSLLAWERRHDHGMVLDANTMSNLELVRNLQDGSEAHTLHAYLNRCMTNGGKRLFRRWLLRPSAESTVIRARQEAVCYLARRQQRLGSTWPIHEMHTTGGSETNDPNKRGDACVVNLQDERCGGKDAPDVPKNRPCPSDVNPPKTPPPCEFSTQHGDENNNNNNNDNTTEESPHKSEMSSDRSTDNTSCRFTTRMVHVDFERSLSRLASLKDESDCIAYVNPLVKYKKNLDLILSTIQAFSDMVQWARVFRRDCAVSGNAGELRAYNTQERHEESSKCHVDTCPDAVCSATPPPLLNELLGLLEAAAVSVTTMEALMDCQAIAETGMLIPSRGSCAAYDAAIDKLHALEQQLHAERTHAHRTHFPRASAITFSEVGKDVFLYEVSSAHAPRVPPQGMIERTRSSKSVKYVVPALSGLIEEHKVATAAKSAALVNVLRQMAAHICAHCPILYAAAEALSYLDCLINLAQLYHRGWKYCCTPKLRAVSRTDTVKSEMNPECHAATTDFCGYLGEPLYLEKKEHANDNVFRDASRNIIDFTHTCAHVCVVNIVHPLLESTAAIPNDISLDTSVGRVLLLTGPNMAGKSTLMRTVAVNVLLAQLGGPVLAQSMDFSPVDRIFTRIGARDITHKGQSTLFVELSETSEILRSATSRSLCLLDELGRGTSTHDGLAIAHATLEALQSHSPAPPLTIFSTHYHALALEQQRQSTTAGRGLSTKQKIPHNRLSNEITDHIHEINMSRGSCSDVDHDPSGQHTQLGYMDFALRLQSSLPISIRDADAPRDSLHDHNAMSISAESTPITFLYRLVRGVCERSYGVEVALMAGIPSHLVQLARLKSHQLSRQSSLHEDANILRTFYENSTC